MTSSTTFLKRLKHLVLSHPVFSHPLFSDLEWATSTVDALRTFTIHYYHHVLRTRLYDAAALACCPHEAIQAALASIVWDEYGGGDPVRTHPAQFRKVLRALGLDPAGAERAAAAARSSRLLAAHFGLCTRRRVLAGHGSGRASPWNGRSRSSTSPLVRGYRTIAGLRRRPPVLPGAHPDRRGPLLADGERRVTPYLEDEQVRRDILDGALRSMDARESWWRPSTAR